MSDKFRRIVAWIAVGFAVLFSLSFIMYMIDPHMLNDVIGAFTVVSGGITLSLFLVIKLDNRNRNIDEAQKQLEEESKKSAKKRLDSQTDADPDQKNKDE